MGPSKGDKSNPLAPHTGKSFAMDRCKMAEHLPTAFVGQSGIQRVALFVETSLASGRDILLGIARYVRGHPPWLLYHEQRGLEGDLPSWLGSWKGDGIIARVQTPAMADALLATKLPVVDTLGVVRGAGFPQILSDNRAIGAMAAEHLLERGLKHFAFLGIEGELWSEVRETSFVNCVNDKGFDVVIRREHRHEVDRLTWEVYQTRLVEWILNMPMPLGIMVCSDQRCSASLDACRRAGRVVPDDIAVIGVDNDEPLCGVCNPPISSVWPNHESIGYEAAVMLQKMMDGHNQPPSQTIVSPKFVVTRNSTTRSWSTIPSWRRLFASFAKMRAIASTSMKLPRSLAFPEVFFNDVFGPALAVPSTKNLSQGD